MSGVDIESTGDGKLSTQREFFNYLVKVPDTIPKGETPVQEVIEMGDIKTVHSPPIPFVLSFNNLTYNVKLGHKMPMPRVFQDQQRMAATIMSPQYTGSSQLLSDRGSSQVLSDTKVLLNDISGDARAGEILAVLGESGSGKTTLLDALANRIAKESLGGTITLNGERLESSILKAISTYVMQDDLLYPMLTVEETLTFAAEFRLPPAISKLEKKQRVQAVINQLGLEHVANTIIGDEGHRGVSGGERRRVSIGVEIISQPIILFLDEPTSGLDSTNAYMVVKVLQRIAQSGSMVITSIHQPSYRILGLIDRLLFLSHGQTVYSGSSANLPSFFADFGHPLSGNENRAEFALDLIQALQDSPDGIQKLVEFNKLWPTMKHSRKDANISTPEEAALSLEEPITSQGKLIYPGPTTPIMTRISVVPTFANTFWKEVAVLLRRSFINSRRMAQVFCSRLFVITFTGVLLAQIFWKVNASPNSILERLGFFAYALGMIFYSCGEALPDLVEERYKFMRETASNSYRRSSYVVSHALAAMPSLVILSLAFGAVTFWTIELSGGLSGFSFYILIILASFWAGNSFVTFLSGFVKQATVGFTLVIGVISYFYLYSGFFVTRENIPHYMIWFHYVSLLKYPYQAMLLNEFQDPLKCFARGVQLFDNTPLSIAPADSKEKALQSLSSTMGMNITSMTCLTTGADILQQQGVTDMSKWYSILVIVAYGLFFRFLFYIALLLGSKNRRT